MPGKRPRPFLGPSCRPQTGRIRGCDRAPASPATPKYDLGAPQRVVVGFEVEESVSKENCSKSYVKTCRSPRSVLETDALSDLHSPPARSLRSVLDKLLSRPESRPSSVVPLFSSSITANRREESAACKTELGRERPIAICEQIIAVEVHNQDVLLFKESLQSSSNSFELTILEDAATSPNDANMKQGHRLSVMQPSIFCAASPFSHFHSHYSEDDFLSMCFLCKCRLLPGKDIYMYRGDRAFCSSECRDQQIVVDDVDE